MHSMLFLMSAAILLAPAADAALDPGPRRPSRAMSSIATSKRLPRAATSTSSSTAARWTARTAGRRWAAG